MKISLISKLDKKLERDSYTTKPQKFWIRKVYFEIINVLIFNKYGRKKLLYFD